MTIARVHSTLSQVIVRRLGDAGGPRADQVGDELDSIITGVNNLESSTTRIKNVLYRVRSDTTATGNVGTGVDTLDTFSLDTPNRLLTNGDYLRIHYAGVFTASANTRRINGTFGGSAYTGMGKVFVAGANVGWAMNVHIVRISSTSVRVSTVVTFNDVYVDAAATVTTFGNAFFSEATTATLTGLSDLSANATTILLNGEGDANDDVIKQMAIIEVCQQ